MRIARDGDELYLSCLTRGREGDPTLVPGENFEAVYPVSARADSAAGHAAAAAVAVTCTTSGDTGFATGHA
ncbi:MULTISPECIES: hypothetical protein [unclassified Nocardia]|uniref:hypothetical protein n=1 Tax=unclassified Nocardia TaxID=2637762 RepID=UPI00278C13DF|nr:MULTISPECIES: hypothetical protein [unclassified Nocardia]